MAIGHTTEPFMLAKLASFLKEDAGSEIALISLAEFGLYCRGAEAMTGDFTRLCRNNNRQ